MFAMRGVCRLPSIKTAGVHGTGSPVACYAISQFHISSLSDARGGKNMHPTVMRKPFDKEVQAVRIIHVKDLVLNLPEFCDVFLQPRYAVKLHTKKHLAFVVRRRCIFLKLFDECMPDLAIRQGKTVVEPHGVVVETACFAGKETE
ncbi:MAG TPA: hypothetical protein VMP68_12135 [Candidatus Eisenbacteria bacterium]|nr:hypothetical protein [Candidatus Eisenbacteria bacterium]